MAFLVSAFIISRQREHVLTPTIIIIAAAFIFLGLFPVRGFLQTITLEQCACFLVAIAFLVGAFMFLQKDRLSWAFIMFIIAATLAVCSFSAIQSLLRTGILATFTNTLVDYSKKIEDFQLTVVKMKADLYDQQLTNEMEQVSIQQAQSAVKMQQEKINKQANDIISLQETLGTAQSNVNKITQGMLEQQKLLDTNQIEMENQQRIIRQGQADLHSQQAALTNQYARIFQMQNQLASAETNLTKQQQQIATVESLVNNLYSRNVAETVPASDSSRFFRQDLGGGVTRVFIKLSASPVQHSIQGIMQGAAGYRPPFSIFRLPGDLVRAGSILLFGSFYYSSTMPLTGFESTNNVTFSYFTGGNIAIPNNAVFVIQYIRDDANTNRVQKIKVKGKDIYFDGKKQIFK